MKKRGVFGNSKGQITIFIIIGILLLVSFTLFFYIRSVSVEKETEPEVRVISEEVPRLLVPVKNYIEECINTKVKYAIERIELQGGYLDSNLNGEYNPSATVTESNAIPYNGILIPYWCYLKSANDCRQNCDFGSLMPALCKTGRNCITTGEFSIEGQIEEYVLNEVSSCIDDFQIFGEQGYEILSQGNIESDVILRDNDIYTYVKFPLRIKKEDTIGEISEFQSFVDTELKKLYTVAYNLTNYESTECYLEDNVQRYYKNFLWEEGKEPFKNYLPPEYTSTIGTPEIAYWIVPGPDGVKEQLKRYTINGIKNMAVANTMGYRAIVADPNDPNGQLRASLQDWNVIYALDYFYDVFVNFDYFNWPDWDTYLRINPGDQVLLPTLLDGGIVQQLAGALTMMRIYEFYYDYSFPVLVTVRSYDYYTSEEELFQFALEGNIRANHCFNANTSITMISSSGNLLCDEERRALDADITVYDENTRDPIPNAKVSFYAGEMCTLGYTDTDGKLSTKYPETYGGVLVFEKEGYMNDYKQEPISNPVTAELYPIRNFTIDVKAIDLIYTGTYDGENQFDLGTARSLYSLESAIINVRKVTDEYDPFGEFQNQFFVCNRTHCTPDSIIKLIPGKYEVDINFMTEDNYTIPKYCMHICEGGRDSDDYWDEDLNKARSECCGDNCPPPQTCDCALFGLIKCCSRANVWLPEEEMEFKQMGGLKLNDETRYWEFEDYNLNAHSSDEILEFKLIRLPKATCISTDCIMDVCISIDDSSFIKLNEVSEQEYGVLKPDWVPPD